MSDSVQLYVLQHARILCPWGLSSKNTGVDCCALLQGIFTTQGSSQPRDQTCVCLHLLHWQMGSLPLAPPGKPTTGNSIAKNPPANTRDARDKGFIPGLGRCPAGGYGNLLQYSCLENSMEKGGHRLQSMGLPRVGPN